MKKLTILAVLLLSAAAALAQDNDTTTRHTLIVRDGKVIADDGIPMAKRAFLGVAVTELTPELREFFGAPRDTGVLVSSLTANGPAAKAGLRVGDVITGANGQAVGSRRQLTRAMKGQHGGDAVRIDVIRGKSKQTLVATAEERSMPALSDAVFELPDLSSLRDIGKNFEKFDKKDWNAFVVSPKTDELEAKIRDLESRLRDLEKRLNQK